MRHFKRLLAAVLTAALAASLAALPAGAAGSSFSDVIDPNTAVNADILRLMGVVDGTGGNYFNPGSILTRAQFCTMVINFVQQGDQVPIHNTRTIFSDVPGSHWARGYVNLAASITVEDGDRKLPLFSGVGDGRFMPDREISLAEATTVIIRSLGYTSKQAGALWPQSYMDLASSMGLLDGLDRDYNAPITRQRAAQLFVNALSCKTASGEVYYNTLGTAKGDTVLLAVNVATDTGEAQGAVRTSSGTYLPQKEGVAPTALQGRRGNLILNDKNEIITFIPDSSDSLTVTLTGDARPNAIQAGGQEYTISSDTPVYTAGSETGSSYLDSYKSLYSGTQVTLFTQRGKVVAIYTTSSGTTIDSDAVVVMGHATNATFYQLTGGGGGFNIVKNRSPIRMSDIRPYDVVTYDPMSNTLVVSDLRITCLYDKAEPNTKTPQTITAGGHEFQVLESAWDTTQNFRQGDSVSLLLTADGKVAGVAAATAETRSTAVAMISKSGAEVFLPNGGTLTLSGEMSESAAGKLGIVSIGRDRLTSSSLVSRGAPGAFDLQKMTLGSYQVASSVRVYEQTMGGTMSQIPLDELPMAKIDAGNIAIYHLNSSDIVDYIVLEGVTGSGYRYGMMVGYTPEDFENSTAWRLLQGDGPIDFATNATYRGKTGDMVGVVITTNREGKPLIRTVIQLRGYHDVSSADFFESQGLQYVKIGGRNYRVAEDVECYLKISSNQYDPSNWSNRGSNAKESVETCLSFSDNLSVYIDPVGEQVRIIKAN